MKKYLATFAILPFFLTACTAETAEMWDDLGKTFEYKTNAQPVKVAQGYSGESQSYLNKGTALTGKTQKTKTAKNTAVVGHQRINTTACLDLDDWYLDGFRVGKSFRSQKAEMFQQRSQYCQGKTPTNHKSTWEKGYQIGIKS